MQSGALGSPPPEDLLANLRARGRRTLNRLQGRSFRTNFKQFSKESPSPSGSSGFGKKPLGRMRAAGIVACPVAETHDNAKPQASRKKPLGRMQIPDTLDGPLAEAAKEELIPDTSDGPLTEPAKEELKMSNDAREESACDGLSNLILDVGVPNSDSLSGLSFGVTLAGPAAEPVKELLKLSHDAREETTRNSLSSLILDVGLPHYDSLGSLSFDVALAGPLAEPAKEQLELSNDAHEDSTCDGLSSFSSDAGLPNCDSLSNLNFDVALSPHSPGWVTTMRF